MEWEWPDETLVSLNDLAKQPPVSGSRGSALVPSPSGALGNWKDRTVLILLTRAGDSGVEGASKSERAGEAGTDTGPSGTGTVAMVGW